MNRNSGSSGSGAEAGVTASAANKKIIALCGGIGAGKSTAAKFLRASGYTVIDSDLLAKKAAQEPDILGKLRQSFGEEIFDVNGSLKRSALRQIAFQSAESSQKLDDIFMERVLELMASEANAASGEIIFAEITVPDALRRFSKLLFDIWLIESDIETRLKRVMFRDNVSEKSIRDIIQRQNLLEKLSGAKILTNNSTVEKLHSQIRKLLSALKASEMGEN